MGNEVTQGAKHTSNEVYSKEVEHTANGTLAAMFRALVGKMGLTNKLKVLCKRAELKDRLYRTELDTVLDKKLDVRLYDQATDSSMTFNVFVKTISHLLEITDFRFTVAVRTKRNSEWIEVTQHVVNTAGPLTDLSNLSEDELRELIRDAKAKNNKKREDNE